MAPIGPSGGGPVGSSNSFTGAAQTLEYLGNGYWGGWSGVVEATNGSDGTFFEFQSPSVVLRAKFVFIVNKTGLASTEEMGFSISFNDALVADLQDEQRYKDLPSSVDFMIPAFTNCIFKCKTDSSNTLDFTALLSAESL